MMGAERYETWMLEGGRGHGNGHILSGHWDNPLEIINVWCGHFPTYKNILIYKNLIVHHKSKNIFCLQITFSNIFQDYLFEKKRTIKHIVKSILLIYLNGVLKIMGVKNQMPKSFSSALVRNKISKLINNFSKL